jgi:uncharacterized membrane protein YhaH (DUF805 family)
MDLMNFLVSPSFIYSMWGLSFVLWIYTSLVFMKIGQKANYSLSGLAWVPGIGPLIVAQGGSGMHWWPWIMLVLGFIPFIGFIPSLIFLVFGIIWMWRLLETINRPGWWVLLPLIPILGSIIYLILLGVAAWGRD